MKKEIVVYQANKRGKIAKFVDGVEVIEGEVVNEGGGFFENVYRFFFSHGATVGGNEWEKSYQRKTAQTEAAPKSGGIPKGKQKTSSEAFTEQVEQNSCSDYQGPAGWG